MKTAFNTSLLVALLSSSVYAGGDIETQETAQEIQETTTKTSSHGSPIVSFGIGGGKISFENKDHKTLQLASKIGYKFSNGVGIYMSGESDYFKANDDLNALGMTALGVSLDVPFTNHKATVGIAGGLGSNVNYNRVFDDFSNSYDFGPAYRAEANVKISKYASLGVSYSKYNFNTNDTDLPDTEPEVISANISFGF